MTTPGWAASAWPRETLLSYVPTTSADPEPPYAVADAWEPPHELALPLDVCDRVRAAAGRAHPIRSGNGTYYMADLDPATSGPSSSGSRPRTGCGGSSRLTSGSSASSATGSANGTRNTKTCMRARRGGSSRASCSSATRTSTTAARWSCVTPTTALRCHGRAGRSWPSPAGPTTRSSPSPAGSGGACA